MTNLTFETFHNEMSSLKVTTYLESLEKSCTLDTSHFLMGYPYVCAISSASSGLQCCKQVALLYPQYFLTASQSSPLVENALVCLASMASVQVSRQMRETCFFLINVLTSKCDKIGSRRSSGSSDCHSKMTASSSLCVTSSMVSRSLAPVSGTQWTTSLDHFVLLLFKRVSNSRTRAAGSGCVTYKLITRRSLPSKEMTIPRFLSVVFSLVESRTDRGHRRVISRVIVWDIVIASHGARQWLLLPYTFYNSLLSRLPLKQ
jgi:hypothetical protein